MIGMSTAATTARNLFRADLLYFGAISTRQLHADEAACAERNIFGPFYTRFLSFSPGGGLVSSRAFYFCTYDSREFQHNN